MLQDFKIYNIYKFVFTYYIDYSKILVGKPKQKTVTTYLTEAKGKSMPNGRVMLIPC